MRAKKLKYWVFTYLYPAMQKININVDNFSLEKFTENNELAF